MVAETGREPIDVGVVDLDFACLVGEIPVPCRAFLGDLQLPCGFASVVISLGLGERCGRLVKGILETSPALRVYQVRDLAVARSMVEDRAVYGGLVLPRTGRATLVVANGGGHAVEAVLVQLGQQVAGTALNTVDVAPTSPGDPNGLA